MGHAARLRQHIFRKNPRQPVLADHHLHIHAELLRRAQHLDHPPHRWPRRRRPLGDLNIHHQAFQIVVPGRRFAAQHPVRPGRSSGFGQLLPLGNQNRLRHALVEGRNGMSLPPRRRRPVAVGPGLLPRVAPVVKDPHDRRVAPFQHPRNPPLPPPIGLRRLDLHQNLVALHRAVHLVWGDKYIFLA